MHRSSRMHLAEKRWCIAKLSEDAVKRWCILQVSDKASCGVKFISETFLTLEWKVFGVKILTPVASAVYCGFDFAEIFEYRENSALSLKPRSQYFKIFSATLYNNNVFKLWEFFFLFCHFLLYEIFCISYMLRTVLLFSFLRIWPGYWSRNTGLINPLVS